MTLTDVLNDVRAIVHDDAADASAQTMDDDTFTVFANEGMRYIFDRYADSRIATDGTLNAWAAAVSASPAATLILDTAYQGALVEYICYRFYGRDSGDTRDQIRASEHYKRFQELLAPR